MAEHSGRYDEFAQFFAKEGFAVHALDLQGLGIALFHHVISSSPPL
jgi:alpha-beta hydrolase superfamily lysophospholipase